MFGGGSSLTYTPSLVILGHYFKRNMGLVNGFVTIGSSIFTVAMPHILKGLLSTPSFGLKGCFLFLSGLTSIQMAAALTFQPLMPEIEKNDEDQKQKGCLSKIINVDNWKNPKDVVWSLAIPSALFGYFVPYVHIVSSMTSSTLLNFKNYLFFF
jgi:MCP family monocarboxylic acid transporter-like MFS transporter 10